MYNFFFFGGNRSLANICILIKYMLSNVVNRALLRLVISDFTHCLGF